VRIFLLVLCHFRRLSRLWRAADYRAGLGMSWGVPVWLAGKDTLDHGFEKREWQALIVGIERRLVVLEAEPLTGIKVRAVAELLPHVVINPCLLAIVKHLEYLVVLRDPSHLRLNIWRKQRRP